MDTNTLSPKVAAATSSSTSGHAGNRNLSANPCVPCLINRDNVI